MSKTILTEDQVKDYVKLQNDINESQIGRLWKMAINKYSISQSELEKNFAIQYTRYLYMDINWNAIDWTEDKYVIQVKIVDDNGRMKIIQIVLEKRFFSMTEEEQRDYLSVKSLHTLNTVITDIKIKLASTINSVEHNKFFDELKIEYFHHISEMFAEKKNE